MGEFKKFFSVGKKYIQYLLKLGFKEFFVNAIELILLAILSCLIYLPIGMFKDIIFKLLIIFIKFDSFYYIYDLIFNIICACAAIYIFVKFFNKRYENIEEIRKDRKEIMYQKNDDKKDDNKEKEDSKEELERRERAMEEFELPKELDIKHKK